MSYLPCLHSVPLNTYIYILLSYNVVHYIRRKRHRAQCTLYTVWCMQCIHTAEQNQRLITAITSPIATLAVYRTLYDIHRTTHIVQRTVYDIIVQRTVYNAQRTTHSVQRTSNNAQRTVYYIHRTTYYPGYKLAE